MKRKSNCSTLGGSKPLTVALLICLLLLVGGLIGPTPAAAQLPVPTSCQVDVQAENDEPGQKDLTQFCVDSGDNSPYELHTLWNWDLVTLPGGNTGDACTLYDTDNPGDGLADLAVCVTIVDGGQPASLGAVRLFTCNDTRPDRCAGDVQINVCTGGDTCLQDGDCPSGETCALQVSTQCEVSQETTDPFVAGDDYPVDTQALCVVDLDDFGLSGASATLIDACSYPSEQPNSDPSDCILFQGCADASECDDGNDCTIDTCELIPNTNIKACKHTPDTGAFCGDTPSNECENPDTCNSLGFCQDNGFKPEGTACGDPADTVCDNPDTCDAAGGCQANSEPVTTECRADAGECDVAEYCDGAGSCPADVYEPEGTACGDPADTVCDNPDTCDASGGCQANSEPVTTECRADAGECDVAEYCDGAGSCPADVLKPAGTPCGDAAADCVNQDTCDGEGLCVDNGYWDEGTACGDQSTTVCTKPDACDDSGYCLPNNLPCGSVTDSSLCQFDVSDVACGNDDRQFQVLFTPYMQNWVAFKLNASNPGQYFYNMFVEPANGESSVDLTIEVPWPFVTQGATPVHVYDGERVRSGDCFIPPENALQEFDATWTMENWNSGGTFSGEGWTVDCPAECGPDGTGNFCTLSLFDVAIPESGIVYVNVHLDFGLKGPHVDANPCDDELVDRYDRGMLSEWESADAYVDTADDLLAELALADCQDYVFSHHDGNASFDDTVQSLNVFKPIFGALGRCKHSNDGSPCHKGSVLALVRKDSGEVVKTGMTDKDGFYVLQYKHKGPPALYIVILQDGSVISQEIELQDNGWVEVNFDLDTETSTVNYGKGKDKRKYR